MRKLSEVRYNMKTIYVTFTYAIFKLVFENDLLADNFEATFQATSSHTEHFDNTIDIMGEDDFDVERNRNET